MTRFAEATELLLGGMPQAEIDGYGTTLANSCLDAASAVIETSFARVGTLPITAWSAHVTLLCVYIATKLLRDRKNYDQDSPILQDTQRNFEWAMAQLKAIEASGSLPSGVTDSTPTVEEGGTYVVTNRKRGWR